MQLLIQKGGQWKTHKYIARFKDENGEWTYVYPEDDVTERRTGVFLAKVLLPDGSVRYIRPRPEELEEVIGADGKKETRVKGGRAAVRKIIQRGLFGEYGFYPEGHKKAGQFWQHKGILYEYRTYTTQTKAGEKIKQGDVGKIRVEKIPRARGFIDLEFRDSSIRHAYDKELPQKIEEHRLPSEELEGEARAPAKENRIAPEGTSDRPVGKDVIPEYDAAGEPIEMENRDTIHAPRKRSMKDMERYRVAVGEKLSEEEDPVVIAQAYLDLFLWAKRPSTAMTPEGRKKAREDRKGQFDLIVGKRHIKPLPAWAVNKFDSAEHLQRELSRTEGKPMSALITLGLWDKAVSKLTKRFHDQLVNEWHNELRYHTRRAADAYKETKTYRTMDDDGEKHKWIAARERDLYQGAVVALLQAANKYIANDEPQGSFSRFDKYARNEIMSYTYRTAEAAARELGATGIVPEELMEQESAKQGPHYVITPQEHYELKHYGPLARKVLDDALADLPVEHQQVFRSRLWFDDPYTGIKDASIEDSEEYRFNLARLQQTKKRGGAADKWGRPWVSMATDTAVPSIAEKMKDVEVTQRSGERVKLSALSPELQRYYLQQWYAAAQQHVQSKLKSTDGKLTAEGHMVERWLRLEAKLAHVNRRTVVERSAHPVLQMPLEPHVATKVAHENVANREEVRFFRTPGSNQELGRRLGILRHEDGVYYDRFDPLHGGVEHVGSASRHLRDAQESYKLITNARKLSDIKPAVRDQTKRLNQAKSVGHWAEEKGSPVWREMDGVDALHATANEVRRAQRAGDAKAVTEAVSRFAKIAANVSKVLPSMATQYAAALGTPGPAFSNEDLSSWKARAHQAYRAEQNRMHVLEYEAARRKTEKSVSSADLRKAFVAYDDALEELWNVIAA